MTPTFADADALAPLDCAQAAGIASKVASAGTPNRIFILSNYFNKILSNRNRGL
jgi:hypothetical protein